MKTEQELIELAGNALFEAHVTKGMDIDLLLARTRLWVEACLNGIHESLDELNFKRQD